jgi:hypothetical protein
MVVPIPLARSLDLLNSLVTFAKSVTGISTTDGSNIQRTYAVTISVDPTDPTTFINGRQVWFFPATEDTTQDSRAALSNGFEIGIVVAEQWLSTPATIVNGVVTAPGIAGQGPVPDWWTDIRVNWTEALYDALKTTQVISGTRGAGYYRRAAVDPAIITAIYDRDELLERKLFFSEMQMTWNGWTDLTGN